MVHEAAGEQQLPLLRVCVLQVQRQRLRLSGMDEDGTLHWVLPDRRKSYYDESYLPKKLDRVDEAGNLYFDGGIFPWKLADDFAEDKRWGYPKWKVLLGKLTGKGKKGD